MPNSRLYPTWAKEREACWEAVRSMCPITHDDLPLAIAQAFTSQLPEVPATSRQGGAMTATAQKDRATASAIAATGPCVQGCAQCEGVMADRIAAALAAARQEEREACAKVAEQHGAICPNELDCKCCFMANDIASAIRRARTTGGE